MKIQIFEPLLSRSKYTMHHDFVRGEWSERMPSRAEVASLKGYSDDEILFYAFMQEFLFHPEKALNPNLIDALIACDCAKDPTEYVKNLESIK